MIHVVPGILQLPDTDVSKERGFGAVPGELHYINRTDTSTVSVRGERTPRRVR